MPLVAHVHTAGLRVMTGNVYTAARYPPAAALQVEAAINLWARLPIVQEV